MAQDSAVKNWMFTCYPDLEKEELWEIDSKFPDGYKYIYQLEKCPETGRLHYQGYFRSEENVRFPQLKLLFPDWHLEKRKGTHKQAYAYCTKSETRQEGPHGNMEEKSNAGARTDLVQAKQRILGE